jgi:glutamine synthetase
LVENFWAPVFLNYGFEDRNAAIRLITPPFCSPGSSRIEVRVPGADINTHLALSAIIGCGFYGIENNLGVTETPTSAGGPRGERLPQNLKAAVEAMTAKDSMARKVLGDGFVKHYAATRLNEWQIYERSVTNWELTRYLELV